MSDTPIININTSTPTEPGTPAPASTGPAPESASASSSNRLSRLSGVFGEMIAALNATVAAATTTPPPAPPPNAPTAEEPDINHPTTPYFIERRRQGARWTETATSGPTSFRDSLYFFSLYISGLRFPENASINDYSLGIFLYFLKISILVISNITLNATVWTGIIESMEAKKFPGNTRIPQEFLVANMANEHLSFPFTLLYDTPTGSRNGLPVASAALFGIFVAACVSRLLVLLVYKFLKINAKTASASPPDTIPAEASESTPLLPTPTPKPVFVTLVDRYSSVNTWRVFLLPLITNTLGTLFTFAIINGIALSRVDYPTIPDGQTIQSGNPLNDPQSYMLLLTLVSLATSFVFSFSYAVIKPLTFRREGVYSYDQIVTEGTNPIYRPRSISNDPEAPPTPQGRRYCC